MPPIEQETVSTVFLGFYHWQCAEVVDDHKYDANYPKGNIINFSVSSTMSMSGV